MPRPEPGIGVRIRTLLDDGDGLAARVVDVDEDRVCLRVPRNTDPQGHVFVSGGEVQLILGRRDSAYVFHAVVLSRPEDGVIAVVLCGHPLRLQRREFFRLAVRLPIAVRLNPEEAAGTLPAGEGEPGDGPESGPHGPAIDRPYASTRENEDPDAAAGVELPAPTPQVRIFRLADLSGGGCLCLDPDGLLRRGHLYRASLDLHDGAPPLQVSVEVVRRGISFGSPSVGLRFVAFAEKHRERIMRSLFNEHRRRSTTGRI
jgi:c-di-GMP-binding flagellar brake protein YcgR